MFSTNFFLAIVVTDDADSSGDKQNEQKSNKNNKSLMHSGSLDGSLIKLSPHYEFDFNFNSQRLQKPDFDSTGEDTMLVTIIQKPEMPRLEANLVPKPPIFILF